MVKLLSNTSKTSRSLLSLVLFLGICAACAWPAVEWTVNRWSVPQGYSLLLRYKGPLPPFSLKGAEPGKFAKVSASGSPLEIGTLERMAGPGRHFYCPLWWECKLTKDIEVQPGEVAVFTSKLGADLPPGQFLVDGELGESNFKGVLRRVYGPGIYRVNPFAYEFEIKKSEQETDGNHVTHSGWVDIPAGHVGVVTNQADNPITNTKAGIQKNVFPPGLYPINPREQKVDIVEIGFREKSISVEKKMGRDSKIEFDASGEPLIAADPGGISFPSNDGFTIYMDFTAIWGIMPDQAADAISKFGNVQAVENKVVVPQIESILRIKGSRLGAVELLVGESRLKFQIETSEAFREALHNKDVTLQTGLVRYIFIPQDVRTPIQNKYLADELTLTRQQEELTAKTEAELRRAEKQVELEAGRVRVETEKMVAEALAEGEKIGAEARAKTVKLVAEVDKKTADLEAQATILRGQAESSAQQMLEEAKAQKFQLAVGAFGSGEAYNQWVFASGLPDDLKLHLLYAGEGTFWTDLKGFTDVMLGRQVQQQKQSGSANSPKSGVRPVKE